MSYKLLKSSAVYVFLGFLAPAVNFFLLPIYTRHLDKADYALITLAMLVQAIVTPLLHVGMLGAYSRYFYDNLDDKSKLDKLLSTTLIFYLVVGIVFWILGALAGPWIFDLSFKNDVFTFERYGPYILITALASNIQILILTYYRNQEQVSGFAFWSVLFFITAATGIYIGVAILDLGADGSIKGRMWGSVIALVPLFIFFFRKRHISFDWSLCKSMLPYALPLVPYILLNIAFANFDKALVERNFALSILGEYGFAVLIASVIEIIMNSVQSAIYPHLFRLLGKGNSSSVNREIVNVFKLTLVLNMITIALLISFTGFALHLFIEKQYWDIMRYFPLLCLVYLPRIIFTIWCIPIMYQKKTKYLPFINALSLLLGVFLGIFLIRPLGIFALPIALFSVQVSQDIFVYFLNRHLKLQMEAFRHLKKEYILIGILMALTLVSTYLYLTRWPNVNLFLPVFFVFQFILLVFYFPEIRKFIMHRSMKAKAETLQ